MVAGLRQGGGGFIGPRQENKQLCTTPRGQEVKSSHLEITFVKGNIFKLKSLFLEFLSINILCFLELFCYYHNMQTINVGAVTIEDTRAYFSNFGRCVNIFAPGVGIPSANSFNESEPAFKSGTSMACPHVSGKKQNLCLNQQRKCRECGIDQGPYS